MDKTIFLEQFKRENNQEEHIKNRFNRCLWKLGELVTVDWSAIEGLKKVTMIDDPESYLVCDSAILGHLAASKNVIRVDCVPLLSVRAGSTCDSMNRSTSYKSDHERALLGERYKTYQEALASFPAGVLMAVRLPRMPVFVHEMIDRSLNEFIAFVGWEYMLAAEGGTFDARRLAPREFETRQAQLLDFLFPGEDILDSFMDIGEGMAKLIFLKPDAVHKL